MLVPQVNACCDPCDPVSIPGSQGEPGTNGTDGTDGINAFTIAESFVMPAELGSVTVDVENSDWMTVGQVVFASGGSSVGYFSVDSKPDSTSVILTNLADAATDAYQDNSVPTTVFPGMTQISPGGIQGPQGTTPSTAGFLQSANNLSDVANAGTAQANLGLGSIATFDWGVANGQVLVIHDAAGIGANEFLTGTGLGVQGLSDAEARTAMGLGTAAVEDTGTGDGEIPVNDGALTNGDAVFATANGLETKSAADARTALGITSGPGDILIFAQVMSTGVDGGTATAGSDQTVPINSLIVDSAGIGSIVGNNMGIPAGTWRYKTILLCSGVGSMQSHLYDATATANIANSFSPVIRTAVDTTRSSAVSDCTTWDGRFIIGSARNIQLRARVEQTVPSFGFGRAASFGASEVYSYVVFVKES